jgi:ribose/xylose/arabinose/galactoside ABC-type transport system permease subunit
MGTALGAFNGLLSVSLKVHTLIVTLGTMTVFQGLSYIISRQSVILNLPPAFKFFGQGYIFGFLPFSVVLMIITVAFAGFILNFTRFGRQVYGVGSNEETARLSGVNVTLIRMIVFSICGFFVALSSIVLFGRSGSASSSTGPGVEFTAMTSAILGGISFTGGEGKMWGLVTGVLILGVLSNGMQLVGLNTYVQYIVKGFVLLLAVGFDLLQKQGLAKASVRASGKQA